MRQLPREERITRCLEMILKLTGDCREAVEEHDPARLLGNLKARQQPMDQIDAIRADGREWSEHQRQLLESIRDLDKAVMPQAQCLMEECRQDLRRIRNERKIQAYAGDSAIPRHYLDTRE